MVKGAARVSAIFLTTIIITLVLVGGTVFILDKTGIFDDTPQTVKNAPNATPMAFEADETHNQTVLFALGDGEDERGVILFLARFQPTDNRITLVPIPNSMICQVGTKQDTAYGFFRKGGVISASKAVSATLNIPIDKYLYLGNTDFGECADSIFGGVRYNLAADVIYENTELGEDVVIRSGTGSLNGNQIRQLLGDPSMTEQYRAQQIGFIFSDMINQSVGDRLYNALDDDFLLVVNKAETNISYNDYSYRKEVMQNMIVPGTSPVQVTVPAGTWAEDGTFTASVEFKNELAAYFGVEPLEILA